MISVHPISIKLTKYCSHCDEPAVFELCMCNPKVIQQSATACLCDKCMEALKTQLLERSVYKVWSRHRWVPMAFSGDDTVLWCRNCGAIGLRRGVVGVVNVTHIPQGARVCGSSKSNKNRSIAHGN